MFFYHEIYHCHCQLLHWRLDYQCIYAYKHMRKLILFKSMPFSPFLVHKWLYQTIYVGGWDHLWANVIYNCLTDLDHLVFSHTSIWGSILINSGVTPLTLACLHTPVDWGDHLWTGEITWISILTRGHTTLTCLYEAVGWEDHLVFWDRGPLS